MSDYVITITREFGSHGTEIGRKLGQELGIPVYDKEIIENISRSQHYKVGEMYRQYDELLQKKLSGHYDNYIKFGSPVMSGMFEEQCQVIRNFADAQNCIFIGRCADYALRDRKNCLNIFIYAPYSSRFYYILNKYEFTEEETTRMIRQVDKARHDYYKHYTGQNRGAREEKHLMINSEMFGVEGTVNIIKNAVMEKFF